MDDLLARAAGAGAEVVNRPARRSGVATTATFTDPDGYLWEVAWGAFEFNGDGSLRVT